MFGAPEYRLPFAPVLLLALVITLSACGGDDPTDPADQVESVALDASDFRLLVGGTRDLDAEVLSTSGDVMGSAALDWESSSSATVTVDQQGVVTAVGGGSAVISASAGGKTAQVEVSVPEPVGSIGPDGGSVTDQTSGVTLVVPAGAVSSETAITVAPALPDSVPSAAAGRGVVEGGAFELGPPGIDFTSPVTLSIPFDEETLDDDQPTSLLSLAVAEDGAWVDVESEVDQDAGAVSAEIDGFSVWALLFEEDAPPTADILGPAAGSFTESGGAIVLEGVGSDPEDGELEGSALVWSSDLDGELGSGAELETTLSDGRHLITLEARDQHGGTGTATVRVVVGGADAVRVTPEPDPSADIYEVATPALAVERTLRGGTITVADGSYIVEGVVIDKPLTIQGEGSNAEIRNEEGRFSFRVDGIESGLVEFRNLLFIVLQPMQFDPLEFSWAIFAGPDESQSTGGRFDELRVEGSVFEVAEDAGGAIGLTRRDAPAGDVVLAQNSFRGGYHALRELSGGSTQVPVELRENTFDGSEFTVVFISGWEFEGNDFVRCLTTCIHHLGSSDESEVGDVRVIDNDFADCSENGHGSCVYSSGGAGSRHVSGNIIRLAVQEEPGLAIQIRGSGEALSVDVVDNEIENCPHFGCIFVGGDYIDQDDAGGVTARIEANIMSFPQDLGSPNVTRMIQATVESGTIHGNTLAGCSDTCLYIQAADATVTDNEITIRTGDDVDTGIRILALEATGATATVGNNSIIAASSIPDPHDLDAYALRFGALSASGDIEVEAVDNTFENAVFGIRVSDGARLGGSGNVITRVHTPISIVVESPPGAVDLHENDFLEWVEPFNGSPDAGDLTCNWWGDASGPSNVPDGTDGEVYSPWATGPIAGDGTGECDGGNGDGRVPAGDAPSEETLEGRD